MVDIERELKRAANQLPGTPGEEAMKNLAERAAEQSLLDVAYATVDSPLGELTVAATPRGLVRLAYPSATPDEVLNDLARRVSPRVLEAPSRVDPIRRELDEYFEGRRRKFGFGIDFALTRGFTRRVLASTAKIGYGVLRTYAQIASSAGSDRAVRAAGNALGANPMPIVVPCHRVVRTGGGLGGYTGGLERKQFLLGLEGVLPSDSGP